MELRIILKDPADGDPLDQVIPGVWSDCATIGWKLTYEGEEYGSHITQSIAARTMRPSRKACCSCSRTLSPR